MKKLLASVITLLLLVSVCLIAAFPTSAADVNYDDFEFSDGTLIEYLGDDSEVVVPSVDRDGNPVTHIDSRAFRYNESVTSVVISEGIETMGNEVFEFCSNLVETTLPYSLTEAGYSIFRHTNLQSIVVPGQLKIIPSNFIVANSCSDIVISPGVEEIQHESLYGSYTEIIFPSSVLIIEASTFPYQHSDCSLYFCNPDVILGRPSSSAFGDEYGAIFWERENSKHDIRFYSLKGSAVEDFVKEYQSGMGVHKDGKSYNHEVTFMGVTQEKLDQMQAKCEERGITSAPEVEETPDDTGSGTSGTSSTGNGSGTTNKNNNDGSGSTSTTNGDSNMLMIIIIVVAAFFFIIIIVVVVVLVVVMNKKNKKKNKKKKKEIPAQPVDEVPAEEPVAEAPAEEVPAEETPTEEKGEEE